jgi:hypothetical protein
LEIKKLKTVISGWTYFDCTNTGTRSYYKPTRIPYVDDCGQQIENEEDWLHSRNQQRNWETILQCLSLRCQPMNITPVSKRLQDTQNVWTFAFEVDRDEIFQDGTDQLGLLKKDCHGVPMIVGLDETWKSGFLMPYLITHGENTNIVFHINQSRT